MASFGPAPTVARPDLFPKSADQATLLKQVRGLWTDPDFPPNDASLFGAGKSRPASFPTVSAWLRPKEFAPLPAGEEHALVFGDAAAGDVVQGALGDCYLLGALSTVAASHYRGKSRLLRLVMPSDGKSHENPPEGKEKGFFTFRFYIFGEWVQVSVDTLIPCGADRRPVFARCRDDRELWVLYLEKAFAKLHGSYRAIEGGSLTSALVDLTGGFAEEIDLLSPKALDEIESGRLWHRLMRYQRLGYLMGCAVSVPGGETEEVTKHNLMQNHAYGILLHYEQKLSATAGEPLRLVKLRNPWGRGEWTGPWADGSREWQSAAGEFAADQLDYTFEEDGTFFVEFGQYAQAMNTVYVCKVLPEEEWHRSTIEGSWSEEEGTAGGCFNFPTWRGNPQWLLRVPEASHAHFVMLQPDPRAQAGKGTGGRTVSHTIGLYLMHGHDRFLRRVLVNSDEIDGEEVVDSTDFVLSREVSCNTLDEEGELPLAPGQPYVLVPSTFLPGQEGRYKVIIYTHRQPTALEVIPPLRCVEARGSWRGPTAGGPRSRVSWKRNPQFLVHARSGKPTRISIVLHREDPSAADALAGVKGAKRKGLAKLASFDDDSAGDRGGGTRGEQMAELQREAARALATLTPKKLDTAIGFVVAHAEAGRPALADYRALHVHKGDFVDSADYAYEREVACEFVLKEAGTFVIVPSTSEPGQELDFGINVYSDEPVELAPVSEWLATEASGEWKGRSAGGCRNSKAWVANPMYALRVQPGAAGGSGPAGSVVCHAFLSQQPQPQRSASAAGTPKSARSRGGGGAAANDDEEDDSAEAAARALSAAEARAREKAKEVEFEGIGFYLLPAPDERDGGAELGHFSAGAGGGLGLVTSGFYSSEEVGKEFTLELGERYLLMPSTYRKGVQGPFQLQLFSEAPLELRRLKPNEQAKLTEGPYRTYAAEILQKAWVRYQIRKSLKQQDRTRAHELALIWFSKPYRDSDEGFRDLNFAINALEAAYIQLTGEPDAHGRFFPRMRNRLGERGIKVADYDMCLPGPQED